MRSILLRWLIALSITSGVILTLTPLTAHAQNEAGSLLATILPESQDLQGFDRAIPMGEFASPGTWQPQDGRWVKTVVATSPAQDLWWLNQSADQLSPFWRPIAVPNGRYSLIERCFWSTDGLYRLEMRVALCNSVTTASAELTEIRQQSQIALRAGTFHSPLPLGDESWFYPISEEPVIRGRYGRLLFTISGGASWASKKADIKAHFPAEAVEAVAYQILLRASQQPELTGMTAQASHLAVNGRSVPKGALKVAGRVYVPVQAFAKAMGLTSGWDAKTGALTLSGPKRKTVALTAGSTAATVGGAKAAALIVPVLKIGGEPVMALSDLLTLTGGRITGHAGNTVQVKG